MVGETTYIGFPVDPGIELVVVVTTEVTDELRVVV